MAEIEKPPAIHEFPSHPCYQCLNALPKNSNELIDEGTVCLDGKTPKPNCPFKVVSPNPANIS